MPILSASVYTPMSVKASELIAPASPSVMTATFKDAVSLTKPRLSSLVMITTAGGMYLAPGPISSVRALAALVAIAGIVGAANALNCYMERDSDRFMKRTAKRPLPGGRMEPRFAVGFGALLLSVGLPVLALTTNLLTAVLGLLAFLSYVVAYTPLKARSDWAMVVGAIPGALPPLMGWTAVTGKVQLPGLVLFAVLFFWQMPHFLAIALFRKSEYAAAGLKSVPLVRGDNVARLQAVLYTVPLVAASLTLYVLRAAGLIYVVSAGVLGAAMLFYATFGFMNRAGDKWAKRMFVLSLVYLTGLFFALWVDGGVLA